MLIIQDKEEKKQPDTGFWPWPDPQPERPEDRPGALMPQRGEKGDPGAAASVTIGTVTTLEPGESATVTNVGTDYDAILNFGIPKGADGRPDAYVTPEEFGAVGNGTADDTNAITSAIHSGHNVMLNAEKKYRITSTIVIDEVSNRKGRTIFSSSNGKWSNDSVIVNAMADASNPIFLLQDDGFTFEGLTVNCKNTAGSKFTFIKTDISAVDVDLLINECNIINADYVVDGVGRGFHLTDNQFAKCSGLLTVSWGDEDTGSYHDYDTGMRAIRITGNRLHSMNMPGRPIVVIKSGRAVGMQIANNLIDRGESCLLKAGGEGETVKAYGYNWSITGNVFMGLGGYSSPSAVDGDKFIMLCDGVDGLLISGNSFQSGIDQARVCANILCIRDAEGEINTYRRINVTGNNVNGIDGSFIKSDRIIEDSVFSSNSVNAVNGKYMIESAITGCNIVGNMVHGITESVSYGLVSGSIDGCEIGYNAPFETQDGGAVSSVNGQTGDVVLSASDVGALPDSTVIPADVTESTVSGWGFTKNTGTYSKPTAGIPKTDLASAVQTSLGKADTALQSLPTHSHEQSDITGLSTALSGKANSSHTHEQSDISGLSTALSGKANANHTHEQSDITGLSSALSTKADASNVYSKAYIDQLIGVVDGLAEQINEVIGL